MKYRLPSSSVTPNIASDDSSRPSMRSITLIEMEGKLRITYCGQLQLSEKKNFGGAIPGQSRRTASVPQDAGMARQGSFLGCFIKGARGQANIHSMAPIGGGEGDAEP